MITFTSVKKNFIVVLSILFLGIIVIQSFAQQKQDREEPAPKNLKVLPKTTTGDQVHQIMKTYARSLGVRCNHCHASQKQSDGNKGFMKMDFASDDNPHKEIARKMMVMVDSINTTFLSKMGLDEDFEKVTCVTCHMGNIHPTTNIDSLPKKESK